MKNLLILILISLGITAFGQRITFSDWQEQAKTNKRILPKYGHIPKTDEEKKADEEFVKTILEEDSTHRKGSEHLIQLGFNYMYRGDIKTAMYRFNQAWLLDSLNSNVYWGFGAIYGYFTQADLQKEQYDAGLLIDSLNTNILTDYATIYLGKYYDLSNKYNLYLAIEYLRKSYHIDSKNQNTLFKLSICYLNLNECFFAWKYYNECKELGGQPISDAYSKDLKKNCKKSKETTNYGEFKIGTFHQNDELVGVSVIERTEIYQIEENTTQGIKIKLKIEWIDDCIFKLTFLENLSSVKTEIPEMTLYCRITETQANSYIQETISDISPDIFNFQLEKVE